MNITDVSTRTEEIGSSNNVDKRNPYDESENSKSTEVNVSDKIEKSNRK